MCSTHVLPGRPDRKRTMGPLLCQICTKNIALVHLTQITKDKKREMHLCEDCAKKGTSGQAGPGVWGAWGDADASMAVEKIG